MRVIVPQETLRRIFRVSRVALLVAATGLLGYCGFVVAETWWLERQASQQFDRLPRQPAAPRLPEPAAMGGLMGRMEIPRLGLSVAVAEGTRSSTLRRAAGHIEGTEMPGRPGNVGIAGHRDTLFRLLRSIRQDDVIVLTTLQGEYRYRVVSATVVGPHDVGVLKPDGNQILTLVTCYPFYLVGPAPDRFIVRAERVA